MSFTISNNSAVASSSYHLGKNQQALQLSIKKLASGKRLIAPNDDPGSLSVAMKLNAAVSRLSGARNNVQNATSFLEAQDGVLEGVGRIVTRMAELKGLGSQDPMKSSQDIASYDLEFHDLQRQLYDMSQMTFNGASLFAMTSNTGDESVFRDASTNHTISIHTSTQGSQGSKISIHQAALLAALTMEVGDLDRSGNSDDAKFSNTIGDDGSAGTNNRFTKAGGNNETAQTGQIISFAQKTQIKFGTWMLYPWEHPTSIGKYIILRAQVGGGMSRLSFAADSLSVQQTNIRAALGRIEDVDIAEESALIQVQHSYAAAASMVNRLTVPMMWL